MRRHFLAAYRDRGVIRAAPVLLEVPHPVFDHLVLPVILLPGDLPLRLDPKLPALLDGSLEKLRQLRVLPALLHFVPEAHRVQDRWDNRAPVAPDHR